MGCSYLTVCFLPFTEFDVNGSSYNVCATSDAASQRWVFRPAENTPPAAARGTYTVSGMDLRTCVYNVSSSQRLELVVTPPTDQNESGYFDVIFVSRTWNTVTLTVSYSKCRYCYWLQHASNYTC